MSMRTLSSRTLVACLGLALLAGCSGARSFTRGTPLPIPEAFACASNQLEQLGYAIVLADTVGGMLQGHREITGIRETARRGAAAATEMITVGLAGGKRTRYDELTVFVYTRRYPQGPTIETTAGMLITADDLREQSSPTDAARGDARRLMDRCAPWS
jgi:hypothetical protein